MSEAKQFWFPAKRYGWGWGPPVTWQGWLVVAGFLALAVAGVFWFPPEREKLPFIVYFACITLALLGVCYIKGEPPAWRWGKK